MMQRTIMRTHVAKFCRLFFVALVLPFLGSSTVRAVVTFDWATIGDTGNAADTLVMDKGITADMTTGYGSVGYSYQIAKTHVTNNQYAEFLNAVDPNGDEEHPILGNPNGIYNPNMTASQSVNIGTANTGGIGFDFAAPAGSKYSAKSGQENLPAIWINWASSARFVNWLHNGQGTGDTENGVYDLSLLSAPFDAPATFPPRQAGATYFIPSEDEFYKAAYYDPTKNSGAGGYWQYGVQSDTAPVSEGPSSGATSANYATAAGIPGVTGDTYWQNAVPPHEYDSSLVHLTEVGAYTNATSYYGLHDVDGLAYQWTEGLKTVVGGPADGVDFAVYRGGSWFASEERNGAAFRALYSWAESASHGQYGLRIASAVASVTGDFDGDGDVDGQDFLVWQRTDGTPSGLADWQGAYGAGSLAALATVPEPSGLMLCLVSTAVAMLGHRRR